MKNKEYTISEIAKILKITEEEVRKIEKTAIRKLINSDFGKHLKEYLYK